jgi:KDO2-lipid IV(A) lauroyltransferase
MAKLSHNIEYLAAASGVKLAQMLSARAADSLGCGLGTVAHTILASRRRIARDNLKRALGNTVSDEEIDRIAKRVFQNLGRTLIEFSRFGKTKLDGARKLIYADGAERLRKVYEEGNGGIIVSAHFGNWELMGVWTSTLGYPMDFLVGTQHNQKIDNMLIGFRKDMDVGIIRLSTSARQVFKALKAGRFTGLVADQHAASGGIVLDFFGRHASTPKGPALFAIRAGCPLLPCVLRRESYDRHVVMACDPIYPPNTGDEEADIQIMTIAYTKFFESCIREYPDQWMWTHRRWKIDG